jgi:H/ACA ribonucleoprotein complex subunit 4
MPLEKLLHRSVILIDKHKGPTSFDMVEKVSKILKVGKAGHSGTLDPNATGLLVIALGEARKAMPVLTGLDKEYIGVMKLHGDVGKKEVEDALNSFRGVITQMPPVKSAVARKERERKVHEIEIMEIGGRDVKFRVLCEAGTYIRKIAHDAGEKMGCGAHLIELRRTRVGPFKVEDSVKVEQIKDMSENTLKSHLMPLEDALEKVGLPKLVIRNESEKLVRNGSPVRKDFVESVPKKLKEGDDVGIFNQDLNIVCIAKFAGKGDIAAKTERVFL